jgi:hypothetical protein
MLDFLKITRLMPATFGQIKIHPSGEKTEKTMQKGKTLQGQP